MGGWIGVGHVDQVRERGDYLMVELGRESVFIVADDDGVPHAFLNTCRHRGASNTLSGGSRPPLHRGHGSPPGRTGHAGTDETRATSGREPSMTAPIAIDDRTEWLEADGLGGFASGTTAGLRTRRYHALLLAATTPPTGRMVLVNGLDAWIERPEGSEYLTRQRYAPGVVVPEPARRWSHFPTSRGPTWTWRLRDGIRVEQELFVTHGSPVVAMRWRLVGKRAGVATGGQALPLGSRLAFDCTTRTPRSGFQQTCGASA